jgi:Flp pilus assembly protein TadG
MFRRQQVRDEKGAIAVMTAICATMLFVAAALSVDLGNAFMEKRERQKDTDLAVLAGAGISGSNLPVTAGGSCTSASYTGPQAKDADQAVKDVAANLTSQLGVAVTAGQLTDCDATNGEVVHGRPVQNSTTKAWSATFNKNQLSLISPPKHVDYNLANVIGEPGADVAGVATVEIRSPKMDTLPYFALETCSYGAQTLQQTNSGLAAGTLLWHSGESNSAELDPAPTGVTPYQMPIGTEAPADIVITGTGLDTATEVGFFQAGSSGEGPEPTAVTVDPAWRTATQITIPQASVPASLFVTNTYWFVRVKVASSTEWSATTFGNGANETLTPSVIIGSPTLNCGQTSNQGNFGTLDLSNSHTNSQPDIIAYNIADGLEHTLAVFDPPTAPWGCAPTTDGAVYWPSEGTNCPRTKPGLMDANPPYKGLISGVSGSPSVPGLLTDVSAGTGCATNGMPATTNFRGYIINNDNLTCFFTNNTVHVGDVASSTYPGPPVISPAIFNSPRFVTVPIFGEKPTGADYKKIVGFRSGFITDQPNDATKLTGTTTSENGITTQSNGPNIDLETLQIIFLNEAALPQRPTSGGTTVYAGIGPKVPILVN